MATSLQLHDMEGGKQGAQVAGQLLAAPGLSQGIWGRAPACAARGPAQATFALHRAEAAGALSAASPASM